MPYVSAKLGGIAIFLGFFFLSSNQIQRLTKSSRLNYLADKELLIGDESIALEYFRQSDVYGWDNHYANYQMGRRMALRGEMKDAAYRFTRGTLRHPSEFMYASACC